MPRMLLTPLAWISLMMGRTLAANASAALLRTLMDAFRAAARRGPPSLTPRRLAAAKAALVRSLIAAQSPAPRHPPIQKFSFLLLNPLSRTGWKLGMIISELTSKAAGNAFGGQSERITSNSCPGVFSSGIFDKCLPSSAWTDTDVYGRRQLRVIAVHWASTSVLGTSRTSRDVRLESIDQVAATNRDFMSTRPKEPIPVNAGESRLTALTALCY